MAEWSKALPLTASCLSPLRTCLMAKWSKAVPLTASCLSPLAGFESKPGYLSKLPVTWGQVLIFARDSGSIQHF